MKRVGFLLLCTLLFSTSTLFGQWEWVHPRPSGVTCTNVVFNIQQVGYILYGNGDLVTSTDKGANWRFKQNFPSGIRMDLKDSIAVITGYGGVFYISTDGGSTWQKKSTGVYDHFTMVDIISRDTIFTANESGRIFRTDNGGSNWKSMQCGIPISSLEFVNSRIGYAGGSASKILKTEDGGATWKEKLSVNIIPSNTLAMHFVDENTGVAFREHSTILRTTDGGTTWKEYAMHDKLYSFHFLDHLKGFASGEHGVMYKTTDGGISWTWMGPTNRIANFDLHSIHFLDANTGFAVGQRGRILKTTDGGLSWATYSDHYLDISSMAMPTRDIFYTTVGNTIYKSVDRGTSWNKLPLEVGTSYGEYDELNHCHFFNADTGFAAATDYARIYKTQDGGKNWQMTYLTQYSYSRIADLQFLDNQVGFLLINNYDASIIVKTKDGGKSFATAWQAAFQGEVFHKIFFLNERTGFASRYNKLYKTEDSAKTWTMIWEENSGNDILSITFSDAQNGFAAGYNGMLRKTSDSGKTWSRISIAPNYYDDIYNVRFFNKQVGYMVGEYDAIYITTDAGMNWKPFGRSTNSMRKIHFAADSTVYLTGQKGSILRTAAGLLAVDSLSTRMANCEFSLNAFVNAPLKRVDSAYFEYGINDFTQVVPATPFSFSDTAKRVKGKLPELTPSAIYKWRLKLFSNGTWHYGDIQYFSTGDRPANASIHSNGQSSFCEGDSLKLTSSEPTGNRWIWNGVVLPDANKQTLTVTRGGYYQLLHIADCYSSDTASLNIEEKERPKKPLITAEGNILISSGPAGNQWYLGDSLLVGATAQQFHAEKKGGYMVTVTENGCTSDFSAPFNYMFNSGDKIVAYPNPVIDELNIRNLSGEKMQYKILDRMGVMITSGESTAGYLKLKVSQLASGSYFLWVKFPNSNDSIVRQFLKL